MSSTDDQLYRIVLSYACFGIVVRNGTIIAAAPIAKWSVGKKLNTMVQYVRRKNGQIHTVDRRQ